MQPREPRLERLSVSCPQAQTSCIVAAVVGITNGCFCVLWEWKTHIRQGAQRRELYLSHGRGKGGGRAWQGSRMTPNQSSTAADPKAELHRVLASRWPCTHGDH